MFNLFKISDDSGQAAIEYIIIFAGLAFISINLVTFLATYLGETLGNLGYVISGKLSSGVCAESCWYSSFRNGGR